MGLIQKIRCAACLLVFTALLLSYSCGGGGGGGSTSGSGVATQLQPPQAISMQSVVVTATIQDATSGALVSNATLSLSGAQFAGGNGSAITSANAANGVATFYVTSDPAPASINITASAPNYITTTKSVVLKSSGLTAVTIPLLGTAPSSTSSLAVASSSVSASGGAVNAMDSADQGAAVNVPAAALMKDSAGNALSGALNVTIAYVSANSTAGLSALPTTAGITVNDGTGLQSGTLLSAATASIVITDSAGQIASTFANGTTAPITFSLPNMTINPTTDANIKAGDSINVYSFSDTAGAWNFEGKATVTGSAGNYTATYNASHLCFWSTGWLQSALCDGTVTLTGGNGASYTVTVSGDGFFTSGLTSGTLDVSGAPNGVPLTISASYMGGTPVSVNVSNFCSATAQTLDVSSIAPAATGNIAVAVNDVCSANSSLSTPVPSSGISVCAATGCVAFGSTNSAGSATISSVPVGSYNVFASNPNTNTTVSQPATVTANGTTSVSFSFPVTCDALTGGS